MPHVIEYLDQTRLSILIKILIISVLFVVITVFPSYFICRRNPGSAWYVPGLITLSSIWVLSGRLPEYWSRNAKLWLLVAAMILVMIAGIIGSLKGDLAGQGEDGERQEAAGESKVNSDQ